MASNNLQLRAFPETQWVVRDVFSGLQTKKDPSKVDAGACVSGVNTSFNDTDRISSRFLGYETYPSGSAVASGTTPIKSLHTFRKRSGENLMMRNTGTVLEFFHPTAEEWQVIQTGYTSGYKFGYADNNINTDQTSFVYFGNSQQYYSRWNGAYTTYASATSNTLTKQGSTTWAEEGFASTNTTIGGATSQFDITNPSGTTFRYTWDGTGTDPAITASSVPAGMIVYINAQNFNTANNGVFEVTGSGANYFEVTNASGVVESNKTIGTGAIYTNANYVVINSVKYAYTGGTGTTALTGVFPDPTAGAYSAGEPICQGVNQFGLAPKGNIFLAPNNRIFVAGIEATPQAVYFSEYGDATNYTSAVLVDSSTATSPGIFNLAEGGGAVTGMSLDENSNYLFKGSIIYKATLTDDLYSITPLKPFDGRSQTTGSIGQPFVGENGTIFVTPDKKIYYLTRIQQIDYPQLVPISDIIKPTVDQLDFTNFAGIVFRERAYIACSSTAGTQNDTVLVYNLKDGFWETPITGWNVSDWTIYTVDGVEQLFWASNNSPNVYMVMEEPIDGEFDVDASAVMNQETFGAPAQQKVIENFFVEGYIWENTQLTITIYFNDNGYTQTLQATVDGTDGSVIYNLVNLNVFGVNPFGIEMFGTNEDESSRSKFRVYCKNNLRDIPFYNIQMAFSSTGANQRWEVLRYGFKAGIFSQPEDRDLYINFS